MSTEAARLSWAQVCARRLERHALATPTTAAGPADIASVVCGAHAQVLSAAEVSIALRIAGATRADVRRALWEERSLIKTYGPRGTVHLLAARDLPLWTGALAAVPRPPSPFPEHARLTPEQTEQVVDAIADALDGAELTVDELTDAVVERAGPWAGDRVMPAFQQMWPRWRQATTIAAHRGVLCFGPNRGRKVTYTNPRRRLPGFSPAAADTAVLELLRRYLYAFGPAAPEYFAQWLAAPLRWAAGLFDALGDELRPVELGDTLAWQAAGETDPAEEPAGVRLLPYFDAYIVGCHPRGLLFPGPATERARVPSGQAGNFPVLLVDGTVAGVWHQRGTGRRIEVTVEPLTPLSASRRRALDLEVERLGVIMGGSPTLTIGPVTVGAHA
ncbi:MAG TPA: winged helix DNA-binding domain-containing protein [Streptosporangiaceae bacterium]|nr:winged helix DNA-binding domain-containing protein [Streptosporangiaceae bacterium]